jgi:hypothetical protein
VLRVLKPGGHLLAFGGPRTYHRMVCAIEDAGFEVRDCIMWIYGEGMPKSHDVAAAIDKHFGHPPRGRAVPVASHTSPDGKPLEGQVVPPYEPRTPKGKQWQGWGTALKPGYEPIVVARKPFAANIARNVLDHGTGALNIDGCRVAAADAQLTKKYASIAGTGSRSNAVHGQDDRPRSDGRIEPHPAGRWPANIVLSHSPGCRLVGVRPAQPYTINRFTDGAKPFGGGAGHPYESSRVTPLPVEEWECTDGCPVKALDDQSGHLRSNVAVRHRANGSQFGSAKPKALQPDMGYLDEGGASRFFNCFSPGPPVEEWECADGCPVAALDAQSGTSTSRAGKPRTGQAGPGWGSTHTGAEYDDEGGASRYFNCFAPEPFFYVAKATTPEREAGLDESFPTDALGRRNGHPTVKPLALMRHLVRLVAPPGGTVLDPFCGSGTTGIACVFEGFDFIGTELGPAYAAIAKARIAYAEDLARKGYAVLVPGPSGSEDHNGTEQLGLFDLT